jgi:hypothetical protein
MVKDRRTLKGHDTKSLGPSDASDSGSDVNPGEPTGSDSDRAGTGERENVEGEQGRTGSDSGVDRVVDAKQAGLGGGLDEAEEARLRKPRRGSA